MSILICLKIIDFSNLRFLDVCIIILFLVMVAIQIRDYLGRSGR